MWHFFRLPDCPLLPFFSSTQSLPSCSQNSRTTAFVLSLHVHSVIWPLASSVFWFYPVVPQHPPIRSTSCVVCRHLLARFRNQHDTHTLAPMCLHRYARQINCTSFVARLRLRGDPALKPDVKRPAARVVEANYLGLLIPLRYSSTTWDAVAIPARRL
ncbi:hypothetical protein EXIGLDRAFT_194755 [Exidia glandulosa HHB12029]|uniref:Uncharacterized protein n=1 Tax=Exidia glandulosa HHB12029 TaxID=1314781 RepID=A0A165EW44_EXIGL|nr:hypothetical protein EXIGLDRAFT_194755 [Exidia glandulosa HHB12029]